jgi:tRNA(Ser,Leu) C12 N-acetylase TAN1
MAVTEYEDAVHKGEPAEEIKKAEGEVRARLEEIAALIERLARRKSE